MKKFAYILMGPHYDPQKHTARFETEGSLSAIFTVRNFAEAKARVKSCADEGFGVVELCGAFGEARARELAELAGGGMGVGYVCNLPEQQELIEKFFSK